MFPLVATIGIVPGNVLTVSVSMFQSKPLLAYFNESVSAVLKDNSCTGFVVDDRVQLDKHSASVFTKKHPVYSADAADSSVWGKCNSWAPFQFCFYILITH